MKTRKTQLDIPDTPKYWRETLNGREHDFRAPFPLDTMGLLEEMEDDGILKRMRSKDGKPVQLKAKDRRKVLVFAGAALGLCWYDRAEDLETRVLDHETMVEYGNAVLHELYAAEYDPMELFQLMPKLMARFIGGVNADEVQKRRDFSEATPAPVN